MICLRSRWFNVHYGEICWLRFLYSGGTRSREVYTRIVVLFYYIKLIYVSFIFRCNVNQGN